MKKLISIGLFAILALGIILSAYSSSGLVSLLSVTSKAGAVLDQQLEREQQQQDTQPFTSQHYKTPSFLYPSSGSPPYAPSHQTEPVPPIANAAPNQIAYSGSTVMLDARGSYDPNPGATVVYYSWAQISGIPVTLFGSNTANPTFTAPQLPSVTTTTTTATSAPEVTLIFSLTVKDSSGLTSTNPSTTTVVITSNPQYHYQHPIPASGVQYPNAGEQRLVHPYPSQQPVQQPSPQVTNNAVHTSSYPYQNRSAPPILSQFSLNTSPYPYSAQYPQNTIPYLNSPQHYYQNSGPSNYTSGPRQNNILSQSATNVTRSLTQTTGDNKAVFQPNNTTTSTPVNPLPSSSGPQSNNPPSSRLITSPLPANNNVTNSRPFATTTTSANNSNVSNTNQTKVGGGVQFLGQTNVRTLKLSVPGANAVLRAMLFHPINRVDFVNEKRQAELNLIKPHIRVFSHQNPDNRTSALVSSPPPTQRQTPALSSSVIGFDGITESQAGFNGFIFYPPDVQLASGSTYLVEMVNLGGEIFTKQGSSVSIFALPTFFKISGTSDRVTDPKIIYDAISGRWFASIADTTTNDVRIAVSATSDPTGVWNVYRLGFTNCPDQPLIGINDDKFGVSANDFASNCNGAFTGVQYYVLNKSDLVNGVTSPRFVESQPDTSIFSLYPVQSLGSTSTLYMVSADSGPSNSITLDSFTGSVPSIVKSVVSLPIQTTHVPPNGVQPGTTSTVDTGDARVQDAAWYQGKLWLTLNDACTPPSDNTVRSCIRLDQIDTTAGKVLQDFDKGNSGVYYFYPALSIDGNGNLDFIYGYSSTSAYPSLSASGQTVGAPVDTLGQPVALKSGSAADTSGRYGDYFGARVDPSNTINVWVSGEYHSTPQWSTFISAVNTPTTTTTTSHTTTLTLNTITSVPWSTTVTVTGKLTDNAASGAGIGGKAITFTGTGAANLASVNTNTDGTFTASGKAPSTVATAWTVQAHFAPDSTYQASDSNTQNYATLAHTSTLVLNSIANAAPSTTVTVTGKLTDNSAGNVGIGSKTITFTSPNSSPLPPSVTTNPDGTFSSSFTASSTIFSGWQLQAHFAGDTLYKAATSATQSYNTTKSNSNVWSGYATLGGNVLGDPASTRNFDGRLEVFVVQSDHALYHKSEKVAGNSSGWTAYSSLGSPGNINGNPAAARNSDGRLEVFVIGSDHALYHDSQVTAGGSTWSGFTKLGGYVISTPVVAQNSDGRLQVFVIGSNNALFTISQVAPSSNSWSGFSSLGGIIIGNPAAAPNSDGRLKVFVIGSDHALYLDSQVTASGSTWSGFTKLGSYVISTPVVAQNSDGRLQVFVIGSNNALFTISQVSPSSSSWSGFSSLGGTIANGTRPAASLNSGGQLQVFVINTNNSVFYKYQISQGSATWSSYFNLGGIVISNPVVATNSDGRLELFVIASAHALYHNFQMS